MKIKVCIKIVIVLFILLQITRLSIGGGLKEEKTLQRHSYRTNIPSTRMSFHLSAADLATRWQKRLQLVMPAEHATFAYLLVFGGSLNQFTHERKDDILTAGLAHVVAASGMNVAFVLAVARFWRNSHRLSQVLLSSGLVLGYAFLAGWSVPIVRAALGAILVLIGKKIWLRQVNLLYLLCTSAALQLLFSPELITSLSFQLSYLASLGLLALYPLITEFSKTNSNQSCFYLENTNSNIVITSILSYIKATIQVTFSCWLMVTPILAITFGTFSLSTFVSAVLTTWFLPLLFLMASLALLLGGVPVSNPGLVVSQQLVLQLLLFLQNVFFDITHMIAQLKLLQWQWLPTPMQLAVWYGLLILIWHGLLQRQSSRTRRLSFFLAHGQAQLKTQPC